MYRRLAEIAAEYLKKGAKIYVEGRLQTSKWQDQQTGQDRYKTEIVVSEMQMLDGKQSTAGYGAHAQQQNQQPVQQQAAPQQPAYQPQQQAPQQQYQPQQPAPQQQQQKQPAYNPAPAGYQ